jgi:hypothetical protein
MDALTLLALLFFAPIIRFYVNERTDSFRPFEKWANPADASQFTAGRGALRVLIARTGESVTKNLGLFHHLRPKG